MGDAEGRRPAGGLIGTQNILPMQECCIDTGNVLSMHVNLRAASVLVATDVKRCLAAQIITSCNSIQEELEKEFCSTADASAPQWAVVDHVRTHPKFKFGGIEGSKVATVAFLKLQRPEC